MNDNQKVGTVKAQFLKKKLQDIVDVLDNVLGDTDPFIDDDATDEDIQDEFPVFWACQKLNILINESLKQFGE